MSLQEGSIVGKIPGTSMIIATLRSNNNIAMEDPPRLMVFTRKKKGTLHCYC